MSMITPEYVREIFKPMAEGNPKGFFANVDPNVDWTVTNPHKEYQSHPLAGHYTKLEEFTKATFEVISTKLTEPLRLVVKYDPIVSGNRAVVELETATEDGSVPVGKNGTRFNNRYAWVLEFGEDKKIKAVRAYLDSAMVRDLVS